MLNQFVGLWMSLLNNRRFFKRNFQRTTIESAMSGSSTADGSLELRELRTALKCLVTPCLFRSAVDVSLMFPIFPFFVSKASRRQG